MCAEQGFRRPWGVCAGGGAHVCACVLSVRVCVCVPICSHPPLPGTEISEKFLASLNQEGWGLEWAKVVASGALLPETLSC